MWCWTLASGAVTSATRRGRWQQGGAARRGCTRCPDHVALRRVRARNLDLGGSLHIGDATFEALKARLQPLDDDEEVVDVPWHDDALDPRGGPAPDDGLRP